MCRPSHPHDTDGLGILELNSLGLEPEEEAPLTLLIIHRERVNGRVVAELGAHSVGLLAASGARHRAVEEDVVAAETRTAVPTARTRDFSIIM